MSKSQSNPQNTTATTTTLDTKNLNVSGNTGFTAVGGESGSTVNASYDPTSISVTTDAGAISGSTGVANHALDILQATTGNAFDAVTAANALSTEATSNAFGQALHTVSSNADNTVSVIQNLATQFGTALTNLTSDEQTQLGNTVSALNSTYTANNTSANQQVINAVTSAGEQSTSVIKYVVLGLLGAAALFFLVKKS